jgi:predicted nucleotidyltransferase
MTSQQIRKMLKNFCEEHRIATLYAFGSRADEIKQAITGEGQIDTSCTSDIDMAVKLLAPETLNIRQQVELGIELEALLGIDNVDLVMLTEADPFLAVSVIRGERIYCTDETRADEYELYVMRRAGDLAPYEQDRIDNILSR